MIPEPYRAGISYKHEKIASIPLMAYSIAISQSFSIIELTIVYKDSKEFRDIALSYGAEVVIRPKELATDTSPDIEFIRHLIK